METKTTMIVDRGRGPQLAASRITVLDVYYYLRRGHDFEFINRAMPSLTRADFAAVVAYIQEHRADLEEKDRQADEFHRLGMEAQRARGGIFAETEVYLTPEERVQRLREKLKKRLAETNGAGHPG